MPLDIRALGDTQIRIERRFRADRARVFDAFTKPEILLQWMGTPAFPITKVELDLKVGGSFRYEWTAEQGSMGLSGEYLQVQAPERIEHTEAFDQDWTGGPTTVLTEFVAEGAGTLVRMDITYASQKARDAVLTSPMAQGMEMNYLGLDEQLAGRLDLYEINPTLDLILDRVVPVAPEKVWQAWTDSEVLKKWFTPAPWKTLDAKVEPWPGGAFNTTMGGPEGEREQGKGCVLVAVPNTVLVWTDGFSAGFRPNESTFMTGILRIIPHPEGCRYIAIARHKSETDRLAHEEMGFLHGWGAALDQLVALMS